MCFLNRITNFTYSRSLSHCGHFTVQRIILKQLNIFSLKIWTFTFAALEQKSTGACFSRAYPWVNELNVNFQCKPLCSSFVYNYIAHKVDYWYSPLPTPFSGTTALPCRQPQAMSGKMHLMAFKQACTPHLLMCVLYFGLCLKIMGDHRLRIACVLWRMEGCLCVKVTTASTVWVCICVHSKK